MRECRQGGGVEKSGGSKVEDAKGVRIGWIRNQ